MYQRALGTPKQSKLLFEKYVKELHSALQLYKTGENWPCTENNLGPIPLDQLKNIARHSSVETTLGYLIDDTENELANALGIGVHESFSENSDKQQ